VTVPEPVEQALARALARRPEDRFPTAAAFVSALRTAHAGTSAPASRRLVPVALAAAALLALALWRPWRAKAGADALASRAPASRLTQLTVRDGVEEWPAWSPDGKRLLFVATDAGFRQLFVRDLATGEERQVTRGTRDVIQPAWMPDGRHVVVARAGQDRAKLEPRDVFGTYGDDADLWRLDLDTGEERRLVAGAVNPAVSPDGRRLAFDAGWGGARRLWIADTGGRNPQQLTGDSTETVEHVEPRWSPDGRHLAYRRVQKTKSDILVVDVATKAVTWVTDDNVIDLDPVWAPSERALYFTSARGGGLNVWRVAVSEHGAASGKPQQVTTGAGDDLQVTVAPDGRHLAFTVLGVDSDLQRLPVDQVTGRAKGPPETVIASTRVESRGAWSPDGTRIAFNSDRRGDMNIWVRDADGTERQLTSGPGGDYQPEWSPNGQVIAFFSARAGSSDIWTVRVADGTLQRLTQPPGLHTNPFFSPDGRQIAFHSDRDGRNEVWVMNADGSDLRRLTTTGVSGHFVRWTADGGHILFRGHTASGTRAMRVDVATGAVEELPEVSSGAHMSFSPDGSRILDVRNHRALWVHPLDGTAAYQVYDVTEPALRIDYPVWSPDGRWILFDRAAPRGGDIWELELLDR
jgi:Tol biopolymer transport system component